MSAAAKWKQKDKEAMASVAAKPDASGFKAPKTDAPGPGGTAGAADILGRGGSQFASKTSEKSTKLETQKPIAASSAAGDRQQGHHSKLPVGKDSARTPQTKEVKGSQVSHPGGASFANPGVSKSSVGDNKESASNSSGGRRSFGVGSRKEEPTKTKDVDVKIGRATRDEVDRDDATVLAAGRTKGLAGFWATQTDDVKSVRKKRLTAVEDTIAPTISENSPRPLEGVVRSEDPGEWKKPIQTQQGWTRNVASSLQTQKQVVANSRSPIINLTANAADDVCFQDTGIRSAVRPKGGPQPRPQSELQRPREKKAVVDRSQDSIVLAENQPLEADPDVVRSESAAEEVVLEKGRTRNLLQHWKNTEVEYNATKTSRSRFEGAKPAWILEIEAAKGNIGGNEDDDYEDEITEETLRSAHTTETKNSERDNTRKRNGGDVDQTAASIAESRGADQKVPLKREGIVASGETKPAPAFSKGQERFEQPRTVRHPRPDCQRAESGDDKFSHFRADEGGRVAAQTSGIPSFDQNTRNKTAANSFENVSTRERKDDTLTGKEPPYLLSEKPATGEFRAWKGTADVDTAPNVKRSTDYESSYTTSAELDTASSKISSTTQSEAGGDHFGYLPDSSTAWTRPNAAQTDVLEAELSGQGEPKTAERGSCVDSFASSVQPQPNSGALEISTVTYAGAYPESAALSEFNPLSTDSKFVSSSGHNEMTEPRSSPTLDDLLRIDSPSFPLDEGVDSTPCLLPTWSIAVENPVENRENPSDYAQADSRQNEASVYHKAVESSVDEAYDYRRADKIEATKKSEPSQRSCCVM